MCVRFLALEFLSHILLGGVCDMASLQEKRFPYFGAEVEILFLLIKLLWHQVLSLKGSYVAGDLVSPCLQL